MTVAVALLALQPIAGAAPGPSPMQVTPGEGSNPPERIGNSDMVTLPNLAPLPPYDVAIGEAEHPAGPLWSNVETLGYGEPPAKTALRFTTTIQNRGRYSFELVGTPWAPDPAHPDITTTHAYQCVRFTGPILLGAQRMCVRYDSVGTLTWHAQHRHFHINGFGRYELRRDVAGRPDMGPAGLVGKSSKVGWCVSDMYNWRADATPGDVGAVTDSLLETYERNWYSECTSPVLYTGASWRQGISPGWADTYPYLYSGQEIPLHGVTDGVYWLVTTINPQDNGFGLKLQETTWADNTSASKVEIYANATKARLLGPMPVPPYSEWYESPPDQPGN